MKRRTNRKATNNNFVIGGTYNGKKEKEDNSRNVAKQKMEVIIFLKPISK